MLKRVMPVIAGLILIFFVTTGSQCNGEQSQQDKEFGTKMATVEDLMANQPQTPIKFSMDRFLVDERLNRFNDPNKLIYLYVVMLDGTWLKYTIVGKVASTSKRLSSPVKYGANSYGSWVVPVPDEMGVYGHTSGNAKVGMSTLGSLFEYGGFISYILSETPLNFSGLKKEMVEVTVELSKDERAWFLNELSKLRTEFEEATR